MASLGIGVVAVVLYAPVGAVSGWPALLANRYIAHSPWPVYSQRIGPFLVGTAQELLGQRGWSAGAWLAAALGLPLVLARAQRLPAATRQLGWLLYAQLTLWLPLAFLQGAYRPARYCRCCLPFCCCWRWSGRCWCCTGPARAAGCWWE